MKPARHLAGAAIAALFFLVATAAGCGGGGASSISGGAVIPAPAKLRTDLLYGYFGGVSANVSQVAGHVNLYFASAWDPIEQLASLTHAKGAGIPAVVLQVPTYGVLGGPPLPASEIRFWLQRIKTAGLLERIVAVYPIDEPDTVREGNRSDAEVTAQNGVLRRVMSEFPELAGAKLAVTYACDTGRRPGIASYDWVGCDHYPSGCGVLSGYVAQLRQALRPDQRLILVPGGADPWRQDPACFMNYAHSNAIVAAVLPFIWQTVTDQGMTYAGISVNGMAKLYCEAGRSATEAAAANDGQFILAGCS
jgi:hypothetical protein